MDDIKDSKKSVLAEISEKLAKFTKDEMAEKQAQIEQNLLEFANFMEAQLALLYIERSSEIPTGNIIKKSLDIKKGIVLPSFSDARHAINLLRIHSFGADLVKGDQGRLEPDPETCKKVTLDQIDIAVIPGLAFDEKGGRLGFGEGYYNRLIAKLPETTRKISIAFEEQVADHVPMESRKYNLDIIITDKRIIYKI